MKVLRTGFKLVSAVGKLIARVVGEGVKDVVAYLNRRKQIVPWPDAGTATTLW